MKNILKFIMLLALLSTYSCGQSQVEPFAKNIDITEFEKLIKEENAQIVDVRTAREFTLGYLENAVNMNMADKTFVKKMNKFDKNKTLYLYCRSGNRSGKAMKMLKTAGFKYIYNMVGGIASWSKAGKKVKK